MREVCRMMAFVYGVIGGLALAVYFTGYPDDRFLLVTAVSAVAGLLNAAIGQVLE
jgi:hypothetical protein